MIFDLIIDYNNDYDDIDEISDYIRIQNIIPSDYAIILYVCLCCYNIPILIIFDINEPF